MLFRSKTLQMAVSGKTQLDLYRARIHDAAFAIRVMNSVYVRRRLVFGDSGLDLWSDKRAGNRSKEQRSNH